jgi:hypothetical protein
MYKLFILQGPENKDYLMQLYAEHDAAYANMYDLRRHYKNMSEKELYDIAVSIVSVYMDEHYNVTIHDDFKTNHEVARFIRDADSRGYTIEFIRLAGCHGEELKWEEAWVN